MNIEQTIKINFIKYGVILGVILLGMGIFTYYFITQITTSPVLFIAAPIIFCHYLSQLSLPCFFALTGEKN